MKNNNTFKIDKITANDLSLNDIYSKFNHCFTSAGEDYLNNRLYNPYIKDCDEFSEYIEISDELSSNINLTSEVTKYLEHVGKLNKYSFLETLDELKNEEKNSNAWHFIIDAVIIFAFILIFIYPGPGVVLFLGAVAYSVSDYFKRKNIIAGKLYVFSYLIKMLKVKTPSYKSSGAVSVKLALMNDIKSLFRPFMAGTFLISESARTNSNPVGIVFDYLRMIFHVDIIKYNSMINFLKANIEAATELFNIVGELDCAISVNAVKSEYNGESNRFLCKAEFDNASSFTVNDLYHPLIKNPVVNTIACDRNVLLTGANATGKSTFLKSIALNALIAQCFGFAFASSYKAPFYKIYSSMALRDDIDAKESYFLAEIKSIKRVLDEVQDNDNDTKIICVIDEILRGTNTVERIAASTEILKCLCNDNILCMAATHDIELTELLANEYDNYHFSESITEDDVKFSYIIEKGPATSRNAIKLLSVLGYNNDLVKAAEQRADDFMKSGKWDVIN